jgi:16S rRNA (guanine(966)-N(2))-methyltransferase RsmD
MRISGGILAGRKVAVPAGIIRPSMDRMRESVFASLGDLSGLSFLDIFSGTGIIALEAASRGAETVDAVEQDKLKRKTLLENVSISPVRINCHFVPAELFIKRAKTNFDIIFLDPPFPYQFKWQLMANIASSKIVKNGSKLLIHRPRGDFQKEEIPALTKTDSREYVRSIVDYFVVN